MRTRREMWKIVAFGALAVVLTSAMHMLLCEKSSAMVSSESVYELSIVRGVEKCYRTYAKDSIELADFEGIYSLFESGWTRDGTVLVPTKVGNNLGDSNLSCSQTFQGYTSNAGGGPANGLNSYFALPSTLVDYGYVFKENRGVDASSGASSSGQAQIRITSISDATGRNTHVPTIGGVITCDAEENYTNPLIGSGYYRWKINGCSGKLTVTYDGVGFYSIEFSDGDDIFQDVSPPMTLTYSDDTLEAALYNFSSRTSSSQSIREAFNNSNFLSMLVTNVKAFFGYSGIYDDTVVNVNVDEYSPDVDDSESLNSIYVPFNNDKQLAAEVMLNKIGLSGSGLPIGNAAINSTHFTYGYWKNSYIYSLYYRYLQNIMAKDEYSMMDINTCSAEKPSSMWYLKTMINQWCVINIPSGANPEAEALNVVVGGDLEKGHFRQVLEWFKDESSYAGMDEGDYANGETDDEGEYIVNPDDGGSGDDAECYQGAGAIGWILCPIIKGVAGVGNYMWATIEDKYMVVPAQEVFKSGGGVEQAWEIVRNVANVLFIVLFLFVIFSQLTGIGIDNYGIKKIMPKLIVVAVLVNLSFLLCELAIDVSNIFGKGLNGMFTNLAGSIYSSAQESSTSAAVGSGVLGTMLAGGGMVLYAYLNPLGVVGLALGVLGVLISVVAALLTLFLILVIREAGIVLLVAVAPVAIVCYMLPNTEKLYKKWFDIFKALLVVYPICGALVGAGKLASSVLSDIPGMELAAMLIQVLPFFLIPMLLRNSLSLLGNVGSRISTLGRNIGRRASAGAQNGIRNSNRVKDFSQYRQEQQAARRAQRVQNRLGGRADLSARQQDRLNKANAVLLATEKKREEARVGSDMAYFNAQSRRQELEVDEAAQNALLYNDDDVLNAERAKGQNVRTDRMAEAQVGVLPLNQQLAMSRAQSRRDAQELKAYQDQFAGYSQAQLRTEAGNASTWLSQPGGGQRMSALLAAMEANGMERDIFSTLSRNNVSSMSGVMQTLAGSKNKVLRAYGKKGYDSVSGTSVDFDTFMDGTGSQSLQKYINDKGKDFLDGLDDKALAEIARHNVGGVAGGAMGTDLLMEAASKINGQDAVNEIDAMLGARNDVRMSGEQLVGLNNSTVEMLKRRALNPSDAAQTLINGELIRASDDIGRDTRLLNSLNAANRQSINGFRTTMGSAPI